MSVTIGEKKLKFHVLGNGFDNVRNDSGRGIESSQRHLGYGAGTAVIDSSGTYAWITQNQGQAPLNYLAKVQLSGLTQETITTIPDNVQTHVYHPSNVENNFGIAFQNFGASCDVYVFDLTTDEVFHHFTTSLNSIQDVADCIMVGDDFYFAEVGASNARVYKLDSENETFVQTGNYWLNNGGSLGFVSDNVLTAYNHPVWFSDYGYKYGYDKSANTVWTVRASGAGGSGNFPRCSARGMCENGHVWLASYVDGAWRWGMYDGVNGGDFNTPTPIKMFGNYGNTSPVNDDFHVHYTEKRKRCAYVHSSWGLVVTDFKDIEHISDEYWKPLAISDEYIIAVDRYVNNTDVFRYSIGD